MILPFKKQFVLPILEGTKIHTIREDKHSRWEAGKTIHFATGVRTKNYNCFKEGVCVSVQTIEISSNYFKGNKIVLIDNRILECSEVLRLAKNDGFNSEADFFDWFNHDFKGKLIHWTNKKY
jgi:uncharacterized protein YqfB (UPF0267 family)